MDAGRSATPAPVLCFHRSGSTAKLPRSMRYQMASSIGDSIPGYPFLYSPDASASVWDYLQIVF